MTTSSQKTEQTLHRGLGQRQIEMIAIGGCIGTGLFMGSGKTISLAGPAVIGIYAVTGIMLYFVMRAMGELLLHDLNYKSFVDFSEDILGPWAGFFIGWSYWLAWIVAAIAELIAITSYMNFWWPELSPIVTALTTILFLLIINLVSIKAFGELEFWLAIVKVVAIIALIVMGLWLVLSGFTSPEGNKASVTNLWSYGGIFPHGSAGVLAGLQSTIFAFAGMEIIGTMMAEAKHPEKMIPDAIKKIPFRILLFYIGTVTVLMMVTPWIHISPSSSPFVGMFTLVGFVSAASIVNLVVLSSALSSSNSGMYATSRMIFGLAQINSAPAIFKKLSSHHVPISAVLLSTFLMLTVGIVLMTTDSLMEAFEMVGAVTALIFIFVWSMILVAYVVHCHRRPQAHQESAFKMPLNRVMPYVVFVFFGVAIYALSLVRTTRIALYILPLWFAGLGLMYFLKTHKNPGHFQSKALFKEKVAMEMASAKEYKKRK